MRIKRMTQLPPVFVETTRQLMGEERFGLYLKSFEADVPVSIRLNPAKPISHASPFIPHSAPVPWCEHGFYLSSRPNFTFDPLFHAGCYYVQEAASMFIHHILSQQAILSPLTAHHSPLALLDLCAAPGGKSTCAIAALPAGTELWSNEPVRQRASILSENIQKWGYPGCHVTNSFPRDYVRSGMLFDIILCDVPCSGEGMFRKDPKTIGEWSPQQVEKCWRLQREIVGNAWQCLRPSGIFIYCTCTFNIKENEENVRWMMEELGAELMPVETHPGWNITGSLLPGFNGPVYRFIPGITRGEGLFMAVLRKEGSLQPSTPPTLKTLKVLKADLPVLSSTCVELTYGEALHYLRGEALTLPPDTPKGIVTVTYHGIPLGPAKNIGNRANNLYPKPWRIKTTHLPQEEIKILDI